MMESALDYHTLCLCMYKLYCCGGWTWVYHLHAGLRVGAVMIWPLCRERHYVSQKEGSPLYLGEEARVPCLSGVFWWLAELLLPASVLFGGWSWSQRVLFTHKCLGAGPRPAFCSSFLCGGPWTGRTPVASQSRRRVFPGRRALWVQPEDLKRRLVGRIASLPRTRECASLKEHNE